MSAKYDFTIEKNSTWEVSFIYKSDANTVVDLAAYTADFTIYDKKFGIEIVKPTISITAIEGKIKASLTNVQTAALAVGVFYYELYLSTGSTTNKLLAGAIEVIE